MLLHLAQRRGALGLKIADGEEGDVTDDGEVKTAIKGVQKQMQATNATTFGEFMAIVQAERTTPIEGEDKRPLNSRKGKREYRDAIRNKGGSYEHCADRSMIRAEFAMLWDKQKGLGGGPLAEKLTDKLRAELDTETGTAVWRQQGLLFGQRRAYWDTGTLGRCVLEPAERCVPHADMDASRYLVVETVNNLKVVEWGRNARSLTPAERAKIKSFLSGPLGVQTRGKFKGEPKRTASVSDLRELMGWGRAGKSSQFRFNIETDPDREINTDWFGREIVHGAITVEKWALMSERVRGGINRALLNHDPDEPNDVTALKALVIKDWAGLSEIQADALVRAWKRRPRPDAKRLKMSRRAVRNLLAVMDREEPWPDDERPEEPRWLTQIEARKRIAYDDDFRDATTGQPLDDHAKRRYATARKARPPAIGIT